MLAKKEPPIVLSVGGSLMVPDGGMNTVFLSNLNAFVRAYVKKGKRFFLVAGGGETARKYIDSGKKIIGDITEEDLDWLGIHSTRLNAHLLRTIFMDIAHPRIIENYDRKLVNWKEPVVIGAGWKPGWSTDYDAVILARDYKARLIVNLTDIDWVYDKDPKRYTNAKPIKKITWEKMQELIGTKWVPGFKAPFDPSAVKLAKELRVTAIVTNGHDFQNLEKIVGGDSFRGTVITPFTIDASFYDREYYMGKKGGMRFGYVESVGGKITYNLSNFYRAFLIKLFLNPKRCLDVGCATGYLVKWLRFFGVEAFGVEISPQALELADSRIKPFLKKGDIVKLPYTESSFDLVLTFDVLQYIEQSKIKKAVEETVRVSKKHILHKIYTSENRWSSFFHGKDFARVTVLPKAYWQNTFSVFNNVSLMRKSFFALPSFFETVFLLKKH